MTAHGIAIAQRAARAVLVGLVDGLVHDEEVAGSAEVWDEVEDAEDREDEEHAEVPLQGESRARLRRCGGGGGDGAVRRQWQAAFVGTGGGGRAFRPVPIPQQQPQQRGSPCIVPDDPCRRA